MDDCSCCLMVTKIIIALTFFIIKLVCLFKIMNNSKKEEPLIEVRYTALNNITDDNFVDWNFTEAECTEEQLKNFIENGVYDTFEFKMKKINKYSKGLLSLTFIDLFFSSMLGGSYLGSDYDSKETKEIIFGFLFLWDIIIFILNLIFFILFSVYYYKGKYRQFLDFGNCDFINEENFDDIYGYIYKVFDNSKIFYTSNLVSLILDALSIAILITLLVLGSLKKYSYSNKIFY